MKKKWTIQLAALLLTFAMAVSGGAMNAAVYAAETQQTAAPETQQTAAPETTTAPETAAASQTTTDSAAATTTVPETTQTTAPTTAPTTASGSTAQQAEQYAFPGLPAGTVLTAQQLADKAALTDASHNAVTQLEKAVEGTDYVAGQVMFLTDDAVWAQTVADAYGAQLASCEYGVAVLKLPAEATVLDAVRAAADPDTLLPAVSPDYIVTVGPDVQETPRLFAQSYSAEGLVTSVPYSKLWEDYTNKDPFLAGTAASTYQWQHENIDTYAAWGTTQGNANVVVAVVDSGVYSAHEDLTGRIASRTDFTNTSAGAHGTHVAGIIGATYGNGKGGSGVAPGAAMIDRQALSASGSGSDANIIKAINSAVSAGADIINMSLGGYYYNPNVQTAINTAVNAGVVVVVAAGNDGSNVMCYPAGYTGVVCVGALNKDNTAASYSNFGSWVTVSAPGSQIPSTVNTGVSAYENFSGTSMATPVVSGAVALYMSAAGNRDGDVNGDGVRNAKDVTQVVNVLKSTATRTGLSGMGAGCVNAGAMVAKIIEAPSLTVTIGGTVVTNTSGVLAVPTTGVSTLTLSTGMATTYIAYTIDGSMPKAANGVLQNGLTYIGPISLASLGEGTRTIRAIAVNGSGLCSAVKTLTLNLTQTNDAASGKVTIAGPKFVGIGRSILLKATVLDGSRTGVIWSITSGGAYATVSAGGVVTAKAAAPKGTLLSVRAASKANPGFYNDYSVTVEPVVTLVTVSGGSVKSGDTVLNTGAIALTPTVTAADGVLNTSQYELAWKTSNVKIAQVSADGIVTPVAVGTVTITAAAQDGSGKTGLFRLVVKPRVTGISLVPATAKVAVGRSVKFTAGITPAGAAVKTLKWTVNSEAAAQKITVSAAGVLTVPAAASIGNVTVTAAATDGSGVTGNYTIQVLPGAAAAVTMALAPGSTVFGTSNSKGQLTAVTLYTSAVSNSMYDGGLARNETTATLAATADNGAPVVYTSSNPSIISVSDTGGVLTAQKAGKAVITALAQDGSGRRATVAVNVLVPVSGVAISTKAAVSPNSPDTVYGVSGKLYAATGTSAVMTARLGTLYGNPTVTKLNWYVSTAAYNYGVRISAAGLLTVPAANAALNTALESGDISITIYAATTDGTNITGSYRVMLTRRTSVVGFLKPNSSFAYYKLSGGSYLWAGTKYQVSTIACDGNNYALWFYSDSPSEMFTVTGTSSNLNLLGYVRANQVGSSSDNNTYYVLVGGKYYRLFAAVGNCVKYSSASYYKYGSAAVRVTAADGTNRAAGATFRIAY